MLAMLAAAITASTVITNADGTFTAYVPYPSRRGETPALVVTNRTILHNGTTTNKPHPLYRKTYTRDEFDARQAQIELMLANLKAAREASRTNPPSATGGRRPLLNRKTKGQPHATQPQD